MRCATTLPIKSFSGSIIHSSVPPKNHFPLTISIGWKIPKKMMQVFFLNSRKSKHFHLPASLFSLLSLLKLYPIPSTRSASKREGSFYWNSSQFQNLVSKIWESKTKSKSHLGMSQNLRLMNLIQRFSQWNAVFCTRQNFTFPVIDSIGTKFCNVLLKWCFFV